MLGEPLGHIDTAVIGAQHGKVIDPARIEAIEQASDGAIEFGLRDAHFRAFRAKGVADVIAGRKAHRKHVGPAGVAQLQLVHQSQSQIGGGRIHPGGNPEGIRLARRLREVAGADGHPGQLQRAIHARAPDRQGEGRRTCLDRAGNIGVHLLHGGRKRAPGEGGEALPLPPIARID